MVYITAMKRPPKLELTPEQKKIAAELGRLGGQTRASNLSPEKRHAIAIKASKAAAKARTRKAKERKANQSEKS
jgi:hypothetical protein